MLIYFLRFLYVCVYIHTHEGQPEDGVGFPIAEVRVVVSHPILMLGPELRSSKKQVLLNPKALFSPILFN